MPTATQTDPSPVGTNPSSLETGTGEVTPGSTVDVTPPVTDAMSVHTGPVTPVTPVTPAPVQDGAGPDAVTVTVRPVGGRRVARSRVSVLAGNVALIVPLLLVNSVAVYGQVMWAHEHLTPNSRFWFVAVGFALAVESIGVYLAAEAHAALMAGDAAARLRLGSYLVGLLAGCLNFAHFAPQGLGHPTIAAFTFGALSTVSPWLWAIRSRSLSRAELRAQGLIDGRSVKFPAVQWLLFPRRSARQFRAAVWAGETNPAAARALDARKVISAP